MRDKVKQTHLETKQMNKRLKVTSDRKMYEILWKVLFVSISVVMVYLSKNIYDFHTSPNFAHVKKGVFSELMMYAVPVAIIHSVFDWMWHKGVDEWIFINYLGEDRYKDELSRKRRAYTIAKWGYSQIYYFISSISGYLLIQNTSIMPEFLGGTGSVYNVSKYRYLEEATHGMAIYYYIQLGKHLSRFFGHVFIRPEGNYFEYVLHHSLSTFLIIFSYCMDMWVIGIFVLVLHDWTDFSLILARAYKDYQHKSSILLGVMYVNATGSWIALRNFIFSYCCVYATLYQCYHMKQFLNEIEIEIFKGPYYFMSIMLTCLEIMHCFWTYFIIQSFISVNVSDKVAKHSYD